MDRSAWQLVESFGMRAGQLADQTALITGGARGIGEELAHLLGRLGANVVIADIRPEGQAVADAISGDGRSAAFIECDLAVPDETTRVVEAVTQRFGGVDVLVNGAMRLTLAPVVATPVDEWDRTFDINLRAAFLTIQQVLPGMLERKNGVVVNMIAYEGSPLTASYAATKVGLRSLAITVAREVGPEAGVSVYAFVPGVVDTPVVRETLIPGFAAALGGSPEELERTVFAQNPGYPALMPVEHCAAALAFTIVHGAEYHGQVADPFEPLGRFGVIDLPRFEDVPSVALTAEASLPQHMREYITNVSQQNRELEARIELRTRELAAAHERFERELEVAGLIQQNFLPKSLPDLPGWRVAAFYRPARELGGDFYDVIPLPDGRIAFAVGDVTDKGAPAALVMSATCSVLRASAVRLVEPGLVLERVNEHLLPDMPEKMFVTCLYGVLDPTSGLLRFANAGHDLPYVKTADGVIELRARGMPLGLMDGMAYEEAEILLEPGDSVLLHSDGIVEAHDPARGMFGFPRLQATVAAADGGRAMIDHVLAELEAFTGAEAEQEDDITMVALERVAP
jgi:serine phosphatase RsbU (regulator of sigma subunit)/NAD(P)-dependent dehydrogenase (short-subunit alcohol dehydrogenase family)